MDLRIVKTHTVIRNAFIQLLSDKVYDDITIQDIITLAMVNRATFYKYYSGKSDLAGKLIEDFRQQMGRLLNDRLTAENQMLGIIMDNHTQKLFEMRKQMLALWKIRTNKHNLYQDMFCMMKDNYIELAKQHVSDNRLYNIENIPQLDYQATMIATMFITSIKYYYEKDMPMPKTLFDDWQQMLNIVNYNY